MEPQNLLENLSILYFSLQLFVYSANNLYICKIKATIVKPKTNYCLWAKITYRCTASRIYRMNIHYEMKNTFPALIYIDIL